MTREMANYQIATQKFFQRTTTNDQIDKKIQNVQNKLRRPSQCSNSLKILDVFTLSPYNKEGQAGKKEHKCKVPDFPVANQSNWPIKISLTSTDF